MRICVIFTGGTIGSRLHSGYIGLSGSPYALIERYASVYGGDVEFTAAEPYSILSENLTEEHLCLLESCVRKCAENCDAVIVTHGTDTLAYTAAYLGFALGDLKLPITLVSSGYPLEDERANGHDNFAAAVEFSKLGRCGVYVAWSSGGETVIHLGVRTLPHMAYSDMVYSVGNSYIGRFADGKTHFEYNNNIKSSECDTKNIPLSLCSSGRVMYLRCMPNMHYPEPNGVSAVLMESYHSGTMCADERLGGFVEKTFERGIPIFLCGAGGRDADYESVKAYREMGVIPLPAASPSAMYIKLCMAAGVSGSTDEMKKIMFTNIAGEYVSLI